MIGGGVALIIQVALLPVKARTRMVESLAASLKQIGMMEGCIASGIEEGVNMKSFAPEVFSEFERASGKAKGALGAAETFCKIIISHRRGASCSLLLTLSSTILL